MKQLQTEFQECCANETQTLQRWFSEKNVRSSEVSVEVLKAKFRILQFIFIKLIHQFKPTDPYNEILKCLRALSDRFFQGVVQSQNQTSIGLQDICRLYEERMVRSSETVTHLQNELALRMSELRLTQQKLSDQKLRADELEQ